jgi:hypothetical protein
MMIKESRNARPRRLRLRKVRKAKRKTPIQRFLAVSAFDFKFVGDHLKNYLTVGALCILSAYLVKKGAGFDRNAPFLGATLGFLVAIMAMAYGCLNILQLMGLLIPARKGWRWRMLDCVCMVFFCFMLTAIITQGMEKV